MRILLVDDDPDLRLIARVTLERAAGCTVTEAATAAGGLAAAQAEAPDAIICDYHLADGDGIAVLEALRADAALRHIPVIMLTAADGLRERFLALGAADVIAKPFAPPDLAAAVARLRRAAP